MIVREFYATRRDGVDLYHTYSDAGYLIKQEQTGVEYEDAIDVDGSPYTYSEATTKIPDLFDAENATAEELRERLSDSEQAVKILLGEAE